MAPVQTYNDPEIASMSPAKLKLHLLQVSDVRIETAMKFGEWHMK